MIFSAKGVAAKIGIVCMVTCVSACTTVDLSQVAIEKQASDVSQTVSQNVVERACSAMEAAFKSKGWNKNSVNTKTQNAVNVLLMGMTKSGVLRKNTPQKFVNLEQSLSDINFAKQYIVQTSKAAEIYLTMAEETAVVEHELSLLEAALLSAQETKAQFEGVPVIKKSTLLREEFSLLQNEIARLKTITDAYGKRMRQHIAVQSKASENS